MRPILLDTCALIWIANRDTITPSATAALEAAQVEPDQIVVSPISAWAIGQLVARGRLALTLNPTDWFQSALDSGLVLAPMTPELLIASSFLPTHELTDPADRIIAATARAYRYRLMTRDRPLLSCGEAGHLDVIAC